MLPRLARRMSPLAAVALVALLAALLPVGGASAASYKKCSVSGKERKLGTTYVTKLSARDASCSSAESLVKAFHACRHKNGDDGKCTTKVKGYSCRETRPSNLKTPTSYDSDVTCTNGSKGVKHHYQQNT